MKKAMLLVPLMGLLVLAAAPAWAAECEGVTYPQSIEVNGVQLQLNGMGVREATILSVNVYVAALYVPSTSSDGPALARADETKRLILTFVRDVDVDDVRDAYNESFPKSVPRGQMGTFRERLDTLLGWMEGVQEGETFMFTYIPGTGLQVQVRGTDKGVIEGADFAEHFFLIWLGEDPPNRGLKEGLLGGECG